MTTIFIEIREGPQHDHVLRQIVQALINIGGPADFRVNDLEDHSTPPAEGRGPWTTGADSPVAGSQAALDRIQAHVDRIAELSGGLAMEHAIEDTLAQARAEPAGGRKRTAASIRKANQTRARNRAAKEKAD